MRSPASDPLSAPARWPPPLRPGGTIGICSPAGPSDPQSISAAAAALRARGYGVVVAPHAAGAHPPDRPYLGGTDADRLADLNALLADPGVDLILCARGGYGTMRLLDRVDYAAAAARPKAVVGYSDITALQLALAAKAGVVSFSGPMATAGHGLGEASLDPWSEASLWAAVGPGAFPRVLGSPGDAPPWRIERPPLSGGAMLSGTLFPVCLTLLASLAGTPFVPDLRGAVLVIEDVHEDLYAVDRYLTQLRLAGLLDGLAGVLIGSFNGTTPEEDAALREGVPRLAVELTPQHVAVASGVAYGHIPCRLTLPVNAWMDVDLTAGTFTIHGPGPA